MCVVIHTVYVLCVFNVNVNVKYWYEMRCSTNLKLDNGATVAMQKPSLDVERKYV